ncbi:MAG TPA: nucleotide exchange factor GrpE [Candidatus Phocaeicola gallinarum]|uniref:Protein GrpE n=2 Tax=Bacteroidales TaxID=171549 RepID=A0ABR8V9A9_9BACT|nr:nucleotide exchange factor GrpE [Phocaeicola faecium]HJC95995.1 nucleotide exchange factor GrpE [Candidatus Phocaeicola gallinarum]
MKKNQTSENEEILKEKEAEAAAENRETQAEPQPNEEEQAELTPEETLTKELEEAKNIIEEQKDKYLRLSAEFDNYRKRTLKEKAELIKNGGEKAISAILPILDDLERALENMQKTDDLKAIHEGIDLIYQKFLKNLTQEGLEKMNPIGENFDTDYHEAVALVPASAEEQKGKVLDCVQTGYKLNDKVIRHAKVVVAQ